MSEVEVRSVRTFIGCKSCNGTGELSRTSSMFPQYVAGDYVMRCETCRGTGIDPVFTERFNDGLGPFDDLTGLPE